MKSCLEARVLMPVLPAGPGCGLRGIQALVSLIGIHNGYLSVTAGPLPIGGGQAPLVPKEVYKNSGFEGL